MLQIFTVLVSLVDTHANFGLSLFVSFQFDCEILAYFLKPVNFA